MAEIIDALLRALQVGIGGACAGLGVDLETLGQSLEVAEQVRLILFGVAPTCGLGG